jgi:uncharacterized protein YoxC
MNNETIQLACIAVIALGVLVQTILLLALFFGMGKGLRALKEQVDDMKTSVMPTVEKTQALLEKTSRFVDKTNEFVERISPRVESTATDVAAFVSGVRKQAADVEIAVSEILQKVEKQSNRIDDMFSGTLDAVDKASSFVTHTVGKPVRQLSGLVAGVKAAVESLRTNGRPTHDHGNQDDQDMGKDMFV